MTDSWRVRRSLGSFNEPIAIGSFLGLLTPDSKGFAEFVLVGIISAIREPSVYVCMQIVSPPLGMDLTLLPWLPPYSWRNPADFNQKSGLTSMNQGRSTETIIHKTIMSFLC